jgi:uncharacterized protein YjbI with pentapeptide repeats
MSPNLDLKKILADHALFLAGSKMGKFADMRDADLSGAKLNRAKFSMANLTGADLREADLTGADLTGADLTGADLRGADLRGADLTGADLTGADLTKADLSKVDLSKTDFDLSDLSGAKSRGTILSSSKFDELRLNQRVSIRADGRKLRRHTVYLPTDLSRQLSLYCAEKEQELSDTIANAVRAYLNAAAAR